MCHLWADPVPCCQERGDTTVRMWFHGSVTIWLSIVLANGRGVVSCIVIILIEKATKQCLKWDTLTAPGVKGVQKKCAHVLERSSDVNIWTIACLLSVGVEAVNVEVDAVAIQVLQWSVVRFFTEWAYFYCVRNRSCGQRGCRVWVIEPLGVLSSVIVFV